MKVAIVGLAIIAMAAAGTDKYLHLDSIIEKVNNAQTTWRAGHNFAPKTPLHYIKSLMGLKFDTNRALLPKKRYSGIEIPEEFDARKQWPGCPTLTQVLDQGNCGACWATAAAGVFTDRVCIASNGTFTLPLSTEQLVACCHECGGGCKGGSTAIAWSYFVTEGLVTGGNYESGIGCQPFTTAPCEHHISGPRPQCTLIPAATTPECHKKCLNSNYDKSFKSDSHKAKNVYTFDSMEAVQEDIMNYGPVVAGYTVFEDFLTFKTGVYQYVTGGAIAGHAVRIIGWGTEDGTPYWLVANSWNDDWDDKGFFKFIRGTDDCGFESKMIAGEVLTNRTAK